MKTAMMVALCALVASQAAADCAQDAVEVGDVCVDKYEASVWRTINPTLIASIKAGTITSAAELIAGGAERKGETSDNYDPRCPDTGAHCTRFYAVSIPGVKPSAFLTWFQAAVTCRNAGKRLATNQEWQMAALGTPDPGTDDQTTLCTTANLGPVNTGSRSLCVSDRGAFDMAGNLSEWVADWVPLAAACPNWGAFSNDDMCLAGADGTGGPAALIRGGHFNDGADAGPLAVHAEIPASASSPDTGFRCARAV